MRKDDVVLPSGGDREATVLSYFEPTNEHVVERVVVDADDVHAAVEKAMGLRGLRGTPAVEVRRPDGSSLSAAFDGDRATLVWVDGIGEPFHSVGGGEGRALVFDYFGSWSESPAEHCVSASSAIGCLVSFALDGRLADDVMFEPG